MGDPVCTLDGCDQPVADAPVCTRCAARCAAALREAADLWPALQDQVARQTRSGDPTPRVGRPAPAQPVRPGGDPAQDHGTGWPAGLVVDLAATEVRDAVRNVATTWARVVVDEVGADPPTGMAALLRWLAGRCEWARHQTFGAEAVDELGDAAGRVRPAVDRAPERVSLGPCDCGHQLTARADACTTACPACGVAWDVSVREQWLAQQARDYRGTPAEVAGWLSRCGIHTTPAMVRGLAHRRRISAVGGLYKLADVEECRLEELAKRSGRMAA